MVTLERQRAKERKRSEFIETMHPFCSCSCHVPNVHGVRMQCARNVYAVCTQCARSVHAVCTQCARSVHAVCVQCACGVHAVCVQCLLGAGGRGVEESLRTARHADGERQRPRAFAMRRRGVRVAARGDALGRVPRTIVSKRLQPFATSHLGGCCHEVLPEPQNRRLRPRLTAAPQPPIGPSAAQRLARSQRGQGSGESGWWRASGCQGGGAVTLRRRRLEHADAFNMLRHPGVP